MLDLDEINNTIEELEHGLTTFDTCVKLSALYIVREHLQKTTTKLADDVTKELSDILPHYQKYVEVKRAFQLNGTGLDGVLTAMRALCNEIGDFIGVLYANTDTEEERSFLRIIIEETASKIA